MYSRKFREKVIWALDNGRPIRSVASDFGISTNTVICWQKNIEPALADKHSPKHPSACSVKPSHFYSELEGYQSQGLPTAYIDESGFKHHVYRPYGY